MAFVWSLYVLWAAVNAYFFDAPPSERFQNIVDFVTPPKLITVGESRFIHRMRCADVRRRTAMQSVYGHT